MLIFPRIEPNFRLALGATGTNRATGVLSRAIVMTSPASTRAISRER
jgi:hypothetical protein